MSADAMPTGDMDHEAVPIACCETHGLHGSRERCFACGGQVEHVPMVAVDRPLAMLSVLDTSERVAAAADVLRLCRLSEGDGPVDGDPVDDDAAWVTGTVRAMVHALVGVASDDIYLGPTQPRPMGPAPEVPVEVLDAAARRAAIRIETLDAPMPDPVLRAAVEAALQEAGRHLQSPDEVYGLAMSVARMDAGKLGRNLADAVGLLQSVRDRLPRDPAVRTNFDKALRKFRTAVRLYDPRGREA